MNKPLFRIGSDPIYIRKENDVSLYMVESILDLNHYGINESQKLRDFYWLKEGQQHPAFGIYSFKDNLVLQERFLTNKNVIFELDDEERKNWCQIQTFGGAMPLIADTHRNNSIENYADINEQLERVLTRIQTNRLHWANNKKLFLDCIVFGIASDLNNSETNNFWISLDAILLTPP